MYRKNWIFKDIDNLLVDKIINKRKISRVAAIILQNRIEIIGDNIENLNKKLLDRLYDPFLLKDMRRGVDRVNSAITNNEKITIYGDYDADGVTSTSILYMYLKEIYDNVDFYIPDRVDEGYGINILALERIQNNGTKLIITVDTGVTAIAEVAYAKELGMDVIVTDHHECKQNVPDCCAIIDPKQSDCNYPFKELAGVGVVFKLITALDNGKNLDKLIKKYMSLVCLGTIADVAPLIDENRVLVILGLKYFSNSGNAGIDALLDVTLLKGKDVTAGNIGFIIAPRINAAGRLGSANKSVELFLCGDITRAVEIAHELTAENKTRQTMEQEIFNEAVEIIESNRLHDNSVIVVAKSDWHHGVIGIVSSKITLKYCRPSILISIDDNGGKGSGRSITNFNLFEALTYSCDTLTKFGGHSLAAGLSIDASNIKQFSLKINEYANKVLKPTDFIPSLYIDYKLTPDDINISTVESLKLLEPFGMGNPTPVFAFCSTRVKFISTISDGKHLKIMLTKDGISLEVIGFDYGYLIKELKICDKVDVAGTLDINNYRDEKKVQLIIKDIRKTKTK